MSWRVWSIIGLSALLLAESTAPVHAQQLRVRPRRSLDLGTVLPGLSGTVAPGDPESAMWLITGRPGAEVELQFTTLPNTLQAGGQQVAISFDPTSAAFTRSFWRFNPRTFDPTVGTVTRLGGFGIGFLWVWIGGDVSPAATSPAGTYSNTITLDVIYTGH